MARDLTADDIRNIEFNTTFRGLDRSEVEATLDVVARRVEELDDETRKLKAELAETPRKDMESELENVGREVSAILQAAREAAESMRERASLDAARWRSESMEEAETARKEAAADAEALRHDAWVTGTDLLEQSTANAEAMRAAAERDVLTVMGEAEREAHRLTSGSRREAEDLIRNANMEAEKLISDATKRRDEIIDRANREAATAQERTRALERRRDELLEELENVRSTLTRLEGSLEERREALDLTQNQEPSNVRVVHPPAEAKQQWELGETVRVVAPEGQSKPDVELADELSEQVTRIQQPERPTESDVRTRQPDRPTESDVRTRQPDRPTESDVRTQQPDRPTEPDVRTQKPTQAGKADSEAPEPQTPEPTPDQTEPSQPQAGEPQPAQDEAQGEDGLEALFASLRGGGDTVAPSPLDVGERVEDPVDSSDQEVEDEPSEDDGTDWIAVRDSRLLPITNRGLRGVKKAITEIQNVALDNLRTTEDWEPNEVDITESLHAELVAVWAESFAAGYAVAEEMAGEKLKRPPTPSSHADREFASDLSSAVTAALKGTGDGPRERQSAASRVFRVWRSDEAERRIRDIAILGYETAIEKSRSVATG
ncbi:MAG TPA: DivIVA domain-containing protein [Acidimicrobiia bacterium]